MVPALYEALKQDVAAPPSQDAFREIGEAIARRAAAVQSARKEATAST
jgi:hypothetical protein